MISIVIAEDQNMLRKAMIQLIEFHDDLKDRFLIMVLTHYNLLIVNSLTLLF